MSIDFEHYQWLLGPDGRECLRIASHEANRWSRMQGITAVQRQVVDTQVALRAKADAKFHAAAEMFFTAKGLQQSTDELIAAYKSLRFAQCDSIADYCCGIGGDLVQLGNAGRATGYDLDPLHVLLANANGEAIRVNAVAENADVVDLDPRDVDAWHIDPDRRASGQRTVQLDCFQPPVETLQSMLEKNPNGAVKLAPATPVGDEWLQSAELQWIGHSRSCQQVVAWFGGLAQNPGQRVATLLESANEEVSFVGTEQAPNLVDKVAGFVIEPHAVVLAAGLAGSLANGVGLDAVIPGGGYLTGDVPVDSPLLTTFQVLETMSFRPKKIRKRLADLSAGIVEVKQRGVKVDPATLQKQWRGSGSRELSVLVTRQGKSIIAIIAERYADNS